MSEKKRMLFPFLLPSGMVVICVEDGVKTIYLGALCLVKDLSFGESRLMFEGDYI